jgi:hypothetical protein
MPNITFDLHELDGKGIKADTFLRQVRTDEATAKVALPQVGDLELEVPPFFIQKSKKGWKIVNPLTAVRNLATRKGRLSVNIKRTNVEDPNLKVDNGTQAPTLGDFSKADRERIIGYFRAVQRGEHTQYTTKNKPRGFPATLYKNARKAGLTEDPNTKTYRKNAVKAKPPPKGRQPRSTPQRVVEVRQPSPAPSVASSRKTKSSANSPLPSLPSLAKSSSTRARSSSESSIESGSSSSSSSSEEETKRERYERLGSELDIEKSVNILDDNRVPYKKGKRNDDKYFSAGVIGYFPKELFDTDTDIELILFLNDLELSARDYADHEDKHPDDPYSLNKSTIRKWEHLAFESNNKRIPIEVQHAVQQFLTEAGGYDYDEKEDELTPTKVFRKALEKYGKGKGKGLEDTDSDTDDEKGTGLYDNLKTFLKPRTPAETYKKAKDLGHKVIHGRNDYPPSAKAIIDKYRDNVVEHVELHRTPLPSLYTNILKVWTKGETERRLKEQPKDTLFHISMWVKVSGGQTILVEKNEVIHLKVNPKRGKEEETQAVPSPPQGLKFGEMFDKTLDQVGADVMFSYSAKDNNCGNFIEKILRANGMDSPQTHDFIGQDTQTILKGFPILNKIINNLTDTAGRANVIMEGGSANAHIEGLGFREDFVNFVRRIRGQNARIAPPVAEAEGQPVRVEAQNVMPIHEAEQYEGTDADIHAYNTANEYRILSNTISFHTEPRVYPPLTSPRSLTTLRGLNPPQRSSTAPRSLNSLNSSISPNSVMNYYYGNLEYRPPVGVLSFAPENVSPLSTPRDFAEAKQREEKDKILSYGRPRTPSDTDFGFPSPDDYSTGSFDNYSLGTRGRGYGLYGGNFYQYKKYEDMTPQEKAEYEVKQSRENVERGNAYLKQTGASYIPQFYYW